MTEEALATTTAAATGVPAALAGLPGRPLVADPSREGFIQTPSPSHAVTAAILRAAYRSQQTEGSFGNEMSVNLSSDRVRVALSLIDGVRAGNDLGALLGYRLERFLHEYYASDHTPTVVELDSTIFPLRRAYPTVAAVDPAANAATEPTRDEIDALPGATLLEFGAPWCGYYMRAQPLIEETLKLEETRFKQTLDRGLRLLDDELGKLPEGANLPGEAAFKLYDTYGFPLDLTQDALREQGRAVDTAGFDAAMAEQKAKARAAWSGWWAISAFVIRKRCGKWDSPSGPVRFMPRGR